MILLYILLRVRDKTTIETTSAEEPIVHIRRVPKQNALTLRWKREKIYIRIESDVVHNCFTKAKKKPREK